MTGVSLERFSKIGRVEDARTGNTLGETIIDLPELGVRVISDDLGRIQLPGLPPGRHRITAERAGYINLEGQLEVPGNPQFRLELNRSDGDPLEPGRVEGRIEGELEDGLSDVDITIRDQDDIRALSNSQGRYVLRNVEPGLVDVTFARLGYAPRTAMMVVHPGRTVEVSTQMVSQPIELAAIEVTVGSAFLEDSGFFRRARGGQGGGGGDEFPAVHQPMMPLLRAGGNGYLRPKPLTIIVHRRCLRHENHLVAAGGLLDLFFFSRRACSLGKMGARRSGACAG
mgnify:CR=1 FL=1